MGTSKNSRVLRSRRYRSRRILNDNGEQSVHCRDTSQRCNNNPSSLPFQPANRVYRQQGPPLRCRRKSPRKHLYGCEDAVRGRRRNRPRLSNPEKQVRQQCSKSALVKVQDTKRESRRPQSADSSQHYWRKKNTRTGQEARPENLPAIMHRIAEEDRAAREAETLQDTKWKISSPGLSRRPGRTQHPTTRHHHTLKREPASRLHRNR